MCLDGDGGVGLRLKGIRRWGERLLGMGMETAVEGHIKDVSIGERGVEFPEKSSYL